MRRDLNFHYRLPVPYPSQYPQRIRYLNTPNRIKCCQFQDQNFQISKSSPGSSSSSSVTSNQGKEYLSHAKPENLPDIQCQNYPTYQLQQQQQQEKAIQCNKDLVRKQQQQPPQSCRHGICPSPSVEYMGASGGRLVSATPPPPNRGTPAPDGACSDTCCNRKPPTQQNLTVSVWRPSPHAQSQPGQSSQTQQPQQQQQQHHQHQQQQQQQSPQPIKQPSGIQEAVCNDPENVEASAAAPPVHVRIADPPNRQQRTVSLPVSPAERPQRVQYSQSERYARDAAPRLARSNSRKEVIKNYIKRETATFFGVCEDNERSQQERWLDRRKRLASRTYGALKEDYQIPGARLRRVVSEAQRARTQMKRTTTERPDVLPGPSDVPDSTAPIPEEEGRSKDSVARMTWDGLSYVVTTLTRHQQRERSQRWSRSYPPEVPNQGRLSQEEGTFFSCPVPSAPPLEEEPLPAPVDPIFRGGIHVANDLEPLRHHQDIRYMRGSGWRRDPHTVSRGEQTGPTIGGTRIYTSVLDRVLDNSDRRQYGMGWVGKFFGRSFKKSVTNDEQVREQLDDMEDYRPMFTYWVTTVQILVLIISVICYGFGPFGIDLETKSGQVLVTSLSLQQVDYKEPANFWFGPRAADLIHLGAKFAPCMRVDRTILQKIEMTRAKERETACCIRNDDSGCVQSSQADCSVRGLRPTKIISTWKKWSAGESGPGGRISGSVCGLDPKFCDAPASVHPYVWPDDITKWPICRKTNTQSSVQKRGPRDHLAEHMVCEVIGHPCCIGIHGQCRITTREYCDFVQGTFHEEASLCSQVSCLNDVCGMISFYFFETPDQIYRLWTSMFLHAGILQLILTILIQYFLMRDLEKLTGSLRIGIIYMGSGVGGNLASSIFVPYRADVGPAGCQFGLLACLIVEVINSWPMLKKPRRALGKLLGVTFALFLIGLLPWVDNYAHLFGFFFGFLLSYALLPFVSFGPYDRKRKVVLIWVCLLSAGFLFVALILLFYIFPVYDCKICSYLNCLPLTRDFCASQNINFMREEPVV
ncbi:PREDICTED: inactive rhomboid protein 2 isoform X1 [Nicrophorus vespilloides]|uniref:Inactive rhomboid protein 2 isoform X1 n=1 Tax=Nicrophorus vespilloides TaxID=110193 RepID=A0ABM1NJA5_NICVS|nr:PREDICTED: inactive rhomboid protein 2 isoform X1 [Nicrophorus vespilloides]